MYRMLTALTLAAVVGLQLSAGAVLAAAPGNDDIAIPQPISYPVFEASPDMTEATLENGEPVCADVEEQGLDQSVWYSMDFDFTTDISIEIKGDPEHSVTAGVYGPFEELPTTVSGLEARNCIYGTGSDRALSERYGPGFYLVQLTTSSETGVQPSIRFTEQMVTVAPWLAPTSVMVPEGVPIDFAWSWLACSRGLAMQAPRAVAQSYLMRQGDEAVFSLSPEDAAGMWFGPDVSEDAADQCHASTSATMHWSWFVDNLTAGVYQLDVQIWASRPLTDGSVSDRGVNIYSAGTSFGEGTIDITVVGS